MHDNGSKLEPREQMNRALKPRGVLKLGMATSEIVWYSRMISNLFFSNPKF